MASSRLEICALIFSVVFPSPCKWETKLCASSARILISVTHTHTHTAYTHFCLSVWLHGERSAPQDQIFFLLNDGFIRQISWSPASEPCVIEIYPCVNSSASPSRSRAVQGCRGGLLSKYEWEMSADLGDLAAHIPALTFPSKGQPSRALLDQRSPRWEPVCVVLR